MIQKKVCLLGPSGVGKTSLVRQFVEGIFSDKYLTSIGVKVDKKQLMVQDQQVQLMLWDMEGIDRYCGFQPKYLRGASAYIIVVDQSRAQSLVEGLEIFNMAKEASSATPILAINKCDIQQPWHWDSSEIEQTASEFSRVFRTSALTGEQVEDMFRFIAGLSQDKP